MTILPSAYMPSVEYVARLLREECVIDLGENYVKRSQRNRASILSANGVMELTVTGHDADLVKDIADEMVKVFSDTVKRVIGAENVNVIDYAYVIRSGPMRAQNTILIALAGAIITIGIIVLKEFMDTTFRTAEEVEEMLELPVLAQVNRIKSTQSKGKKKNKK